MTASSPTCQTCQKTHPWPDGTTPQHPFNSGGLRGSQALRTPPAAKDEPGSAIVSPWPFDPILRQALIDKGVLTPEDLRNAEHKIRAVTGVFEEAITHGKEEEGQTG